MSPHQGGGSGQVDRDVAFLDVQELPSFGFGTRSIMWWGTMGMVLIEATVFGICIVAYFYLRSIASVWPIGAEAPALFWGTVNTLIMLASLWPNQLAKNAADREDRRACAIWMTVCLAFSLTFLLLRAHEFSVLNVSWDTNAYGSVVWMLLGLHTTHLITDALDSAVLCALLFAGPFEGKRFVDVNESALYWYFVVLAWMPIYAVIYLAPRI